MRDILKNLNFWVVLWLVIIPIMAIVTVEFANYAINAKLHTVEVVPYPY